MPARCSCRGRVWTTYHLLIANLRPAATEAPELAEPEPLLAIISLIEQIWYINRTNHVYSVGDGSQCRETDTDMGCDKDGRESLAPLARTSHQGHGLSEKTGSELSTDDIMPAHHGLTERIRGLEVWNGPEFVFWRLFGEYSCEFGVALTL